MPFFVYQNSQNKTTHHFDRPLQQTHRYNTICLANAVDKTQNLIQLHSRQSREEMANWNQIPAPEQMVGVTGECLARAGTPSCWTGPGFLRQPQWMTLIQNFATTRTNAEHLEELTIWVFSSGQQLKGCNGRGEGYVHVYNRAQRTLTAKA